MAESQAAQPAQQATQAPETSQPQAQQGADPSPRQVEPPRKVGSPKKPKSKDKGVSPQEAQRAEQMRAREAVEKKNPFSRDNKAARMQEMLRTMREERGVPEPQERKAADEQRPPEQKREEAGGGHVRRGGDELSGKPGDSVPRSGDVAGSDSEATRKQNKSDTPPSDAVPEWYKREQAAHATEAKARQAQAEAEAKRAQLVQLQADADASLARMAAAKEDPVQFLAEQGMTKEQWDNFMLNGGKLSPEQKQLKAMADEMASMRARVEAAEKNAAAKEAAAQRAAEDAGFSSELNNLTYVPQMGGINAVRARQQLLSKSTGQPVTLKDAAAHLEDEMKVGLSRLLQNPKIRSSLNLDVNTSHAGQAAEQPRTLNNAVTSQSSTGEAKVHPLNWTEKKRLFLQRQAQEQAARTGR